MFDVGSIIPTWLGEVASTVSALTGIILAWYTYRLSKLTDVLATETRLTRLRQESADIQCAVEPYLNHVNLLEITVRNCGQSAAKNLKILIRSKQKSDDVPAHLASFGLGALLPNSNFVHMLGTVPDLLKGGINIVCCNIEYSDRHGSHQMTFEQDIGKILGFQSSRTDHMETISRSLKNIEDTITSNLPQKRMKIDIFDGRERHKEADARRDWIDSIKSNNTTFQATKDNNMPENPI